MALKLQFLGAAQNVTGSAHLVEAGGMRILVDCGYYQERALRQRNWEPFPVPAEGIDAVLLTHAHLDHCGLLPKLHKEGFRGKIYCTSATRDITQIILLDSARIQVEDVAYKRRRHAREGRQSPHPYEPLYTVEDAEACFPLFSTVAYEQPAAIGDGIEATYYDAGHILGSASILLRVGRNGESRTILFSGDVGRWNTPILRDPTVPPAADYVLVESTYGNRLHGDNADISKRLETVITETVRAGGNLLIPSFAVERSQELLYHLNELVGAKRIPPLMVFLDSPMAIRVTDVFRRHPELVDEEATALIEDGNDPYGFTGLVMSRSVSQSKAINQVKGTSIVIAGSGMCTGGRIKHHLTHNIERPESTLLFVGYQASGTLGRIILQGANRVRILGQERTVRARVEQIDGFSAHADRNELRRWLGGLAAPPRRVFVVHGEEDSAAEFSDFLHREEGLSTTVAEYRQTVELD